MAEEFEGCTLEIVTDKSGCQFPLLKSDGIYIPHPLGDLGLLSVNFGKVANLQIRDDDVFIIGYQRSGTHWIYEMIGMIMKGRIETIDKIKEFFMVDFVPIAELETLPSPRILNNHFWPKHIPRDMTTSRRLIYLLRNPKDVAVSAYHFMKSFKAPSYSGSKKYEGTFSDFLEVFLEGKVAFGSWFEYVRAWEDAFNSDDKANPIIVFYEDMKRDTVNVLKRVTERLGLDRSDEFLEDVAAACQIQKMKKANDKRLDVIKNLTNDGLSSAYRKGVIGDWKHHFTVADNEKFDAVYEEKMKGTKLEFTYE